MAKSACLHPHLDLTRSRNQTTTWIGLRLGEFIITISYMDKQKEKVHILSGSIMPLFQRKFDGFFIRMICPTHAQISDSKQIRLSSCDFNAILYYALMV